MNNNTFFLKKEIVSGIEREGPFGGKPNMAFDAQNVTTLNSGTTFRRLKIQEALWYVIMCTMNEIGQGLGQSKQ